jgi:hypothetical protein
VVGQHGIDPSRRTAAAREVDDDGDEIRPGELIAAIAARLHGSEKPGAPQIGNRLGQDRALRFRPRRAVAQDRHQRMGASRQVFGRGDGRGRRGNDR